MEMFLMVATVSFLCLIVTVALFAAATHNGSPAEERVAEQKILFPSLRGTAAALGAAPPRFFVEDPQATTAARVPIEVLLLQIERHVRLEQAAAESFLDAPTAKSLHSRTMSPLMH